MATPSWTELGAQEKEAAIQLGYTKESWDACDTPATLEEGNVENERYSKFLRMLEAGCSEPDVARKMSIAGFTRSEIKSFLAGDTVGSNAVPAPGVFSSLKGGSPAKSLKGIPTVLKTALTSAMGEDVRPKQSTLKKKAAAKSAKKRTFRMEREKKDKEIKEAARDRAKLQRKLQRVLDEKVGAKTTGTKAKPKHRRFSPKRDLERRIKEAKKNDAELHKTSEALVKARSELDTKMEQLLSIRKQVEVIDKKVQSTHATSTKLVELMEQLFQVIIQKKDGSPFTEEARGSLKKAVGGPIGHYYKDNRDIQQYIQQKIENMSNILPSWPETDAPGQGPSKSSIQAADEFAHWDEITASLGPPQGGPDRVEQVIGTYSQHIVAEPPQKPHKHTRTVKIETADGEMFMLGCYHRFDGIRTEEEIAKCSGKLVKVVGVKYDSSPPNQENKSDILAAITPYIGQIRSVELA